MTALGDPGVSVLLMGTGRYAAEPAEAALPAIPAVHQTLRDLREVLVRRCGANQDPDNLRTLEDPPTSHDMGLAVVATARRAVDLLLVYYVGHGLVSASGDLFLAAVGTSQNDMDLPVTALPYSTIRNALINSTAKTIIVILDCCYSGRAVGVLGPQGDFGPQLARYDGGFVLASTGRNLVAMAPPGSTHTAFTGELINVLDRGDPESPKRMTLMAAARHLVRTLPANGLPQPRWMGSDRVGELVLTVNRAYQPRGRRRGTAAQRHSGNGDQLCPYPGLAAFQRDDARWFFGREHLTDELVTVVAGAIAARRCTAVVGPSGAGKSSLLRAGLLAAIARGALPAPGARSWPSVVVTPTSTPMRSLLDGICAVAGWDADAMWERTGPDPAGIAEAMRALLAERAERGDRRGARIILVVDQFEQLFRACRDRHEQDRFVRALAAATGPPDGEEPVALVVLSVRSDFFGEVAGYSELRPALQSGQVLVGPMTAEEITAAIVEPATAAGLRVDAGLVELLLRDVGGGDVGAAEATLPLLAHALRRTWEHRDGRTLTVAGYRRTGGVHKALANTADEVYASLDTDGRRVATQLLTRLVQLGEDTRDTRRAVPVAALCAGLPGAERVLEALASARLVTLDREVAQLVHDSLITVWEHLRRALDDDRWNLVESQKLTAEAQRWERANFDESFLLRGIRLDAARGLRDTDGHTGRLPPLTERWLTESIRQETLRRQAGRRRTVAMRVLAGIAVVLILVTGGTAVRMYTSAAAERDRLRVSASREAAAKSIALRVTQPGDAMLLAVAAWRLSPTPEARGALLSTQSQPFAGMLPVSDAGGEPAPSLATHTDTGLVAVPRKRSVELWDLSRRSREPAARLPAHGPVTRLAFTRDGGLLIGADRSGLRVWRMGAGGSDARGPETPLREITGIAVNPADGSVVVSTDDAVHVMDPAAEKITKTVRPGVGAITDLTFGADGRTVFATAGADRRIFPLDPTTGDVVGENLRTSAAVNDVAVQAGDPMVATAGADGATRLWGRAASDPVATLAGHADAVTAVAFSPDGRRLVTGSRDRTVRVWDVRTHRQVGAPLSGHRDQIRAIGFGPDGDTLISAGAEVIVWNLRHQLVPAHAGAAEAVSFRRGGRQLATVGADGAARLWDAGTMALIRTMTGHPGGVRAITFDTPGARLATGGEDGTVRVRDVETGRDSDGVRKGPRGVHAIAFSPDGSTLAVAGEAGAIRVWSDEQSRPHEINIGAEVEGRFDLTVTADNAKVTAVSQAVKVTLDHWTGIRVDGPRRNDFPPGAAPVVASDDGSVRATISDDQFTRLWDGGNRLLATLYGHRDVVLDAAFSDDRHTLATVSRDGTLMVWDTNPNRIALEICQIPGVQLDEERWGHYISDLPYTNTCDW